MKEFKLIDSTYDAEESKSVLLNLIADKIRFLNTKSLHKRETQGVPCDHSVERCQMLRQEAENLQDLFSQVENLDKHFKIECSVRIEEVAVEGVEHKEALKG